MKAAIWKMFPIPQASAPKEMPSVLPSAMEKGNLQVIPLGNGYAWFDTGSPDRLSDASDFVKAIELRQGVQIACLEEIAYRNEWISKEELLKHASKYKKTAYGKYLKKIAEQDWDTYKEIYNSELFK